MNTAALKSVISSKKFAVALTALLASSGGAAVGYEFARRKLQTQFEQTLAEELEQTRQFYTIVRKQGDFETPEKAVEKLVPEDERVESVDPMSTLPSPVVKTLVDYGAKYRTPDNGEVEVSVEVDGDETKTEGDTEVEVNVNVNLFEQTQRQNGKWDVERELRLREERPTEPYVISRDEYMGGEKEYEQTTLYYYEGDDVLTDDRDEPIPDADGTVGNMNLQRFGHGSNDPNVVYVRNDEKELDFEIIHSGGKFAEEVHGFLEHSDTRKHIGKFRGGYD